MSHILNVSPYGHEVEVKEKHRCSFSLTDLTGVQLDLQPGVKSGDFQGTEVLELQEGQSEMVIGLKVTGNVPHYNITCKK